jgi:phospholipid/cholesterol/gamma-HCH transport system permease protein
VLIDHAQGLLRLLGQLLLDLLQLLRAPRRGPWRDVSGNLYHIGATALPITALVGFMIGIVLAYLMSRQLRQFGADTFIVNILGLALIRELGPMLAAILIAGRSGSAITAQIGVMRVTEELDAMRVMGIPKGFRLVLAACAGDCTGDAADCGVDHRLGHAGRHIWPPTWCWASHPPTFLPLCPMWSKSAICGWRWASQRCSAMLIALIGCHFGLRVKPNTESLGQGTTASVVTSITVVLLVDALAAVVFKNIGLMNLPTPAHPGGADPATVVGVSWCRARCGDPPEP